MARKSTKVAAPTKSARKARGPKAGSAQANQSVSGVKEPTRNADRISTVVPARTGNGILVSTETNVSFVIAPWQDNAATRKLAITGGSLKALKAHVATIAKPKAQLARGVESRTNPNSAKAVADQRIAPATKTTKAAKAPRAEKAAKNKQPSKGADRAYKLGTRKDESKPDTFRRYMLSTIMAHKSTDAAKAAHAKSGKYPAHKLDFNWSAQQGYIVFAS